MGGQVRVVTRGRDASKGPKLGIGRARSRSRSRALGRIQSKSRAARFEVRDAEPELHDDNVNKFVQFKQFGMLATECCRVIAIDEVPEITEKWMVLIKVKASTVSLNDCYIRRGIWQDKIKVPCTPGFDVIGTIVGMGDDVEAAGFDYGDAVAACCRTGGNARYCILHYKQLTPAPGNVDSAQAAAIISTYMTAYQALNRCKPRAPKQTLEGVNILVTGGNGPVGRAVIELAHRAGASKIFATAAKRYHDELNDKGVCPLPLDARLWLPLVKGKMDIVIDGICQDGYESPRAALNQKGHLIIIGMTLLMNAAEPGMCGTPLDTAIAHFRSGWLMSSTTRYCPYESSLKRPEEWKHDMEYLFALLSRGKIKPEIHQRIALDAVPFTHQKLEAGEISGIVVCKPWK